MITKFSVLVFTLFVSIFIIFEDSIGQDYPWLESYDSSQTIKNKIPLPDGFYRVSIEGGSFGEWLRHLPLKPDGTDIYLYDGSKKYHQSYHQAVINIDIGDVDLQQCADAYMRLRSEYMYSMDKFDSISFNYTNGDKSTFRSWINGIRPKVNGNQVAWIQSNSFDSSYSNFKSYLDKIFTYAGTYSLSRELTKKEKLSDISIGDVFVQGGFPGHLAFVVDLAINKKTGEKLFLLAQGFTPAQDFHVLKNLNNNKLSPWYTCNDRDIIQTPEWIFKSSDLMSY